jgi:hypothetical protein
MCHTATGSAAGIYGAQIIVWLAVMIAALSVSRATAPTPAGAVVSLRGDLRGRGCCRQEPFDQWWWLARFLNDRRLCPDRHFMRMASGGKMGYSGSVSKRIVRVFGAGAAGSEPR